MNNAKPIYNVFICHFRGPSKKEIFCKDLQIPFVPSPAIFIDDGVGTSQIPYSCTIRYMTEQEIFVVIVQFSSGSDTIWEAAAKRYLERGWRVLTEKEEEEVFK